MSRKSAPKPPKSAAKNPAPPKKTVFVVVRPLPAESPTFTEPDRAFATRAAARVHADALNRELRELLNPFDGNDADHLLKGGEKAMHALVKKLGLPVPKQTKTYSHSYIDWEAWWDDHFFDMTDAQRNAVWDALDKFDWYIVKATTLE